MSFPVFTFTRTHIRLAKLPAAREEMQQNMPLSPLLRAPLTGDRGHGWGAAVAGPGPALQLSAPHTSSSGFQAGRGPGHGTGGCGVRLWAVSAGKERGDRARPGRPLFALPPVASPPRGGTCAAPVSRRGTARSLPLAWEAHGLSSEAPSGPGRESRPETRTVTPAGTARDYVRVRALRPVGADVVQDDSGLTRRSSKRRRYLGQANGWQMTQSDDSGAHPCAHWPLSSKGRAAKPGASPCGPGPGRAHRGPAVRTGGWPARSGLSSRPGARGGGSGGISVMPAGTHQRGPSFVTGS